MTTEAETQEQQDQQAAEAGFGSGFTGEPIATPEPTPAPVEEVKTEVEEVVTEEAQPEPTPAPTPAPFDVQAEFRRLQGQYGALHDLLKQTLKTKEAEGKPAALTPVELKRMKEQYPELAGDLQEDLKELIAGIAPKATDPKEVQDLIEKGVAQGVEREMARQRDAAVTDRFETWKTDLYANLQTGEKTPEYQAWLKTMSEAEGQAFESSTNPYFVIRKLTAFYEFKDKANKAKAQKDERLRANLTPQGVPRAGQTTMSDEEAMRKGFEAGFSS